MIRIAFVIDRIDAPTAGTEKHLVGLIEGLPRERFEPHLFVLQETPWSKAYQGCPVFAAGFSSFVSASAVGVLRRMAREFTRRRIVVAQTYFLDAHLAGCLAARWAGTPVVYSIRNQGYATSRLHRAAFRFVDRWVRGYLVNSADTGRWAHRTLGIAPERLRAIPNGVDLARYHLPTLDERRAARGGWGFSEDAFVVGIVANLRPIKRIDVFLGAAAGLLRREKRARFVVIGDGVLRETLEKEVNATGLDQALLFAGPGLDIPRSLAGLDVGVLTSDSESFSNTVLEYMASGLPVVCTDVGGLSEAVEEGKTGFMSPAGDADSISDRLLLLARDPDLCLRMGRNGREKVERCYAREAILRKYEECFEEIASRSDAVRNGPAGRDS